MSAEGLLDADRIRAGLQPEVRAHVGSLACLGQVQSTQLLALAADLPDASHAIYLAEQQTAGVGRRGRPWISPPGGNLYFSVARRFDGAPSRLSGLSLVVGLAMAEALHALGFDAVALKWPNDLVVGEQKLGGILVELRRAGEGATQAAIGVGVNVRMPAEASAQIDQSWCDLAGLRQPLPPREGIAIALLNALLPALDRFDREGLSPFQSRWLAFDALRGQPVKLAVGPREIHGTCLGIDAAGALRLQTAEGERVFSGGEVSLRRA